MPIFFLSEVIKHPLKLERSDHTLYLDFFVSTLGSMRVRKHVSFFLLIKAHRNPYQAMGGLPVPHWKLLPQSSSGSSQASVGTHCRRSPTASTHLRPLNCPKISMLLERNCTETAGNISVSKVKRGFWSKTASTPLQTSTLQLSQRFEDGSLKHSPWPRLKEHLMWLAGSCIEYGSSWHLFSQLCSIQVSQ